ncbi:MAG: glucose-6-phosphate isomerase [Spiroplasma sp.]|nr:glucose-6-phosphate isomerase [Spiroplasma sp.]
MINVDLKNAQIKIEELLKYQDQVSIIHQKLDTNILNEDEFCGWIDMPLRYQQDLTYQAAWQKMNTLALKLQEEVDILLVIGIGGSYLGARAAVEMIQGFYNKKAPVKVIYCGNTLSSTYNAQLLDYLADKEFAINVISKSGTTTEPAIAFRLFRDLMVNEQKKSSEVVKNRIVVTTDKETGVLHNLAKEEGYQTFVVPNDIGGRYSVLTPVGIFPMLVAGIDVERVMIGAQKAYQECKTDKILANPAYKYAVSRYHLYQEKNKSIEILVTYELQLQMFAEWWKQLFGESEGKENKGLFPASVLFTTDLHSLGQFIQEGSKIFFETVITIKEPNLDVSIPSSENDDDQLNYLTKYSLNDINNKACQATIAAHSGYQTGNIPNIVLEWEKMDSEMFGFASYFFMRACAMSASLLQVNPFNQPGVEVYKKNMFQLLGKK